MRRILIVVDMQNDFIDGALGTPQARAIVAAVVKKIGKYNSSDIIATRDTHEENYLSTSEGIHLPVVHCICGSDGWQLNKEVAAALNGAMIIDKPTFGSTVLTEYLRTLASREWIEVELVGLCTDICVVSNALLLKAAMPEVRISADSSCCAGVTDATHEAALMTMKSCQIEVN